MLIATCWWPSPHLCSSQAVELWQKRGHGREECCALIAQLQLYAAGAPPYDRPSTSEARVWWNAVLRPDSNTALVGLALLLLDLCPHAAEPERVFSNFGLFSKDRRNRMSPSLMTTLTTIKMDEERKKQSRQQRQRQQQQQQQQQQQRRDPTTPARPLTGDGQWITNEAALAAAAATINRAAELRAAAPPAATPQPAAGSEVDDLLTASPEEIGCYLAELEALDAEDAEDQRPPTFTSFTDLLNAPWPGVNIMAPQLQPGFVPAPQQRADPTAMGSGEEVGFTAAQLVGAAFAAAQP
jgi:hypothetical protein